MRLVPGHLAVGAPCVRIGCVSASVGDGRSSPRLPTRLERHTRLPVWPAWQGLVLVALSQFPFLRGAADRLESAFGGRVCPMAFNAVETDPFVLLVHHRHSFRALDPLRPLFEALILPEGFPAHPHRGFETVTYVLPERGGLAHRDSLGCKMRYGSGTCQWMTAGSGTDSLISLFPILSPVLDFVTGSFLPISHRFLSPYVSLGMLHEEMWDVDANRPRDAADASGAESTLLGGGEFEDDNFELYQLWLNLPPQSKMVPPKVQLPPPAHPSPHLLIPR